MELQFDSWGPQPRELCVIPQLASFQSVFESACLCCLSQIFPLPLWGSYHRYPPALSQARIWGPRRCFSGLHCPARHLCDHCWQFFSSGSRWGFTQAVLRSPSGSSTSLHSSSNRWWFLGEVGAWLLACRSRSKTCHSTTWALQSSWETGIDCRDFYWQFAWSLMSMAFLWSLSCHLLWVRGWSRGDLERCQRLLFQSIELASLQD